MGGGIFMETNSMMNERADGWMITPIDGLFGVIDARTDGRMVHQMDRKADRRVCAPPLSDVSLSASCGGMKYMSSGMCIFLFEKYAHANMTMLLQP